MRRRPLGGRQTETGQEGTSFHLTWPVFLEAVS